MSRLRIGTRGSPLALWQARAVAAAVQAAGGPPCELVTIKTTGDRLATTALADVGGKQLFVKEIEEALLAELVDIAVHSAKDLPGELPEGLRIGATLPREDPRDALVLPVEHSSPSSNDPDEIIAALGFSPSLGTGSIRRIAQLSHRFPGTRFLSVRGNIGTRLRKLDAGGYDLLVLASAALVRLDLSERISARLAFDACLPAPGQGIVAIESRTCDDSTAEVLASVNDAQTLATLEAERALIATFGGNCRVPVGGMAVLDGTELKLDAVVAAPDGSRILRWTARGPAAAATALGQSAARALIANGADEILAALRE